MTIKTEQEQRESVINKQLNNKQTITTLFERRKNQIKIKKNKINNNNNNNRYTRELRALLAIASAVCFCFCFFIFFVFIFLLFSLMFVHGANAYEPTFQWEFVISVLGAFI